MNLNLPEQNTKLHEIFDPLVSSAAFRVTDDETRVCGHFAEITVLDTGEIDVWLVTPDREPISSRKLTALYKSINQELPDVRINKLTGEGWFQCQTLPETLLRRFGVRRRTVYSDEYSKKLSERMKNIKPHK